jgi:predicted methyltransferase
MLFCLPRSLRFAALLTVASLCAACADMSPPHDYAWLVGSPDRSDADRVIDQRRHPEKLLQFYDVRPGMRVLDVSAGRGYNVELLARAVGPSGRVYAQNSPKLMNEAGREAFDARMKNPVNANVVHVMRDFTDPVPPEAKELDLVTFNFNYHDTVWMGVDRAQMNRAIFNSLKKGGYFVVADHSAKPGAGLEVTKSLHRIDEAVVRREIEAAGFKLAASADFLRNPEDTREIPMSKNLGRNDEFVLKFVKP